MLVLDLSHGGWAKVARSGYSNSNCLTWLQSELGHKASFIFNQFVTHFLPHLSSLSEEIGTVAWQLLSALINHCSKRVQERQRVEHCISLIQSALGRERRKAATVIEFVALSLCRSPALFTISHCFVCQTKSTTHFSIPFSIFFVRYLFVSLAFVVVVRFFDICLYLLLWLLLFALLRFMQSARFAVFCFRFFGF